MLLSVDRLNIVSKNTVLHSTNNTLCGKIGQEMTVCGTWISSQIIKGLETKGQEELKGETPVTEGGRRSLVTGRVLDLLMLNCALQLVQLESPWSCW